MNFENYFCIYQNNGRCMLENIELDIMGQCKECIYIEINKQTLQQLKEITKENIDK